MPGYVTDRTESEDLSGRPPERVEELQQKWQRWAEASRVLRYPEELGKPRSLWPPPPWPGSRK